MKHSLKHIQDSRYDKNRSKERKVAERLVPVNVLVKYLSQYTSWCFLNLGLHQDTVTLFSLLVILMGSTLFIAGYPLAGAVAYLLFALLDSTDGDMARSTKPTSYGGTLDSFGADLFYATSGVSVGYYLFIQSVSIGALSPEHILLIGGFTSLTFLFYRLVNAKMYLYQAKQLVGEDHTGFAKGKIKQSFMKKALVLYRHQLVRGNFFAEAGMILWFLLFVALEKFEWLAIYLVIILTYNLLYTTMNFIGTYLYFKSKRHA